jgi:hypothetical protein
MSWMPCLQKSPASRGKGYGAVMCMTTLKDLGMLSLKREVQSQYMKHYWLDQLHGTVGQ